MSSDPSAARPSPWELEVAPPLDRWDDWTELDGAAWPERVERTYRLVPTICFNCESGCGLLAYVDRDSGEIDRFEGIGRSAAQLDARWSITRGDSDDVLQVGYTSAKRDWNGSDYLALASALSDALATLAADIAGGLSAAE